MSISKKELLDILHEKFPNAKQINVTDVSDSQNNYLIEVTDSIFENLTLIKQHRLVHEALSEVLKDKLHAVTIKTRVE